MDLNALTVCTIFFALACISLRTLAVRLSRRGQAKIHTQAQAHDARIAALAEGTLTEAEREQARELAALPSPRPVMWIAAGQLVSALATLVFSTAAVFAAVQSV